MKILHVVMDGFHPDNELSRLDLSSWIKKRAGLSHISKYSREVKSETKLMSPKMWCKLYSKNMFNDIKRYSPNEGVKHSCRIAKVYNEVEQGDWIWNKLSDKGVKSLVLLSYGFEDIAESGKFNKNVYGTVNKLNSRDTYLIKNGECIKTWIATGKYYGLHEVCDGLYKNEVINNKLTELWKKHPNLSNEDVNEIVNLVDEGVTQEYKDHVEFNYNNYKFCEDHITDCINSIKQSDDYYVTISILETDAIYHTCPPYEHIQDCVIDYIKRKISLIIDNLEFDVIILTGDHGMETAPGIRSKKVSYIREDGKEFKGEKSAYNNNIYFYDHSNTIGAYIISKSQEELDNKSEYLSDDIYDYIINKFI